MSILLFFTAHAAMQSAVVAKAVVVGAKVAAGIVGGAFLAHMVGD